MAYFPYLWIFVLSLLMFGEVEGKRWKPRRCKTAKPIQNAGNVALKECSSDGECKPFDKDANCPSDEKVCSRLENIDNAQEKNPPPPPPKPNQSSTVCTPTDDSSCKPKCDKEKGMSTGGTDTGHDSGDTIVSAASFSCTTDNSTFYCFCSFTSEAL